TALVANSLTGLVSSAGGVVEAVKQGAENGGGVIKTLESIASTVFTSGFGLVSLFGGLFGLFGDGGSTEPPPLVKYAMPPRIDFRAAETENGIGSVDYDQLGMPRAYGTEGANRMGDGAAPAITV